MGEVLIPALELLIPKYLNSLKVTAHFRRDVAPALCQVKKVKANEELANFVVGGVQC